MKRNAWSIGAILFALTAVCAADSQWTSLLGTSDYRVSYRWRRLDYSGMSSSCEIQLVGPDGGYVRGTASYTTRSERQRRTVSGYLVDGRSTDVIASCDSVNDLVVDRFIP